MNCRWTDLLSIRIHVASSSSWIAHRHTNMLACAFVCASCVVRLSITRDACPPQLRRNSIESPLRSHGNLLWHGCVYQRPLSKLSRLYRSGIVSQRLTSILDAIRTFIGNDPHRPPSNLSPWIRNIARIGRIFFLVTLASRLSKFPEMLKWNSYRTTVANILDRISSVVPISRYF